MLMYRQGKTSLFCFTCLCCLHETFSAVVGVAKTLLLMLLSRLNAYLHIQWNGGVRVSFVPCSNIQHTHYYDPDLCNDETWLCLWLVGQLSKQEFSLRRIAKEFSWACY